MQYWYFFFLMCSAFKKKPLLLFLPIMLLSSEGSQWRLSPLRVTQFYHSRCHSLCCKALHTTQCFLTWNTGDQKPCWRSQILQSCTMSSYRYPIILTSETGLISVKTDHYSNQAFIAQIVQLSDAFSERNTFLWELRLIKFFGEPTWSHSQASKLRRTI